MVESIKKILLVGEGNFSYALARARQKPLNTHLIATSFDSEEELATKYPESTLTL